MRRFRDLIFLAVGACVLILASRFFPLWSTLGAVCALTTVLILRRRADHRRKAAVIHQRLVSLRSEGLFIEQAAKGTDDDVFYHMILTLLGDLERNLFKLVEKNIQLLSLKEIGRNIISSLDEQRLIDSVFEYLNRGVGYKETAFIILRKKRRCFQAIVTMERPARVIRRVLNFGFGDLGGAIREAFVSGKPFLIKDVGMHPLPSIAGETLFPGSTMTSYLCVPLMKSGEMTSCSEREDCATKKLARDEKGPAQGVAYLEGEECLSCSGIPLLGALVVTDGYRASALTNIDQVTIETVGSLVSSNMENWYLYQELRQEEIFRERVIEGMINGVFVVDLAGTITLANRSAREMSLYKQRQISRLSIGELIIEKSADQNGPSPVFRVFKGYAPLTYHEAYLRRKDGIHIPIRMNASPMVGEDGEIQGAIIEFIDLSDVKRMEEEIRYLDRLAVLGRFTSAVAHEIRNPLTGIAAGIQYLNRSQELSSEQRDNIAFILNEVDRLNRIITDLFKVAKPRDLLCRQVAVDDLIAQSHRALSDVFQNKGIDFTVSIDNNIPPIEVDPDQIVQVFINLLKNASEAVGPGGTVSVRSRIYAGDDPEVVRERGREMVCIEVADNGVGIPGDDREKLFEPFFSRKKGGTGLGLFVSQSIVQHHLGRISVSSEPGKGTSFRVYLPIERPRKGEQLEAGHTSRR
jgi:PAS domain S-box-containing protein